MKPRNLKNAIENGFEIIKIEYKGSPSLKVTAKKRFGADIFVCWINRDYFIRNYPAQYNRL